MQDRLQIFLELAALQTKLNQVPEATKIMSDAKTEFSRSGTTGRISLAEADLAIRRKVLVM